MSATAPGLRVFSQIEQATARLRQDFPEVDVVDVSGDIGDDVRAEVFFGGWGDWNRVLALCARGVQWAQLSGTGIDGVPAALFETVPTVTCSRGASGVPIAEYVLATMLAFEKRLPDNWITGPPKHWNFQRMDTLAGKTLALVGLGGIGREVASRALPFGMRVRALRRTAAPSPVRGVDVVTSLGELLPDADHVVVAAPATEMTRRLLDAEAFAAMKPGVHLVNIARGALVDQDALRAALDDGHVARASLDTVDPEPLPPGHWMYEHPRVFLTPHSSWSSPAYFAAAVDIFAANLRRYIAGEPVLHVVDVGEGY